MAYGEGATPEAFAAKRAGAHMRGHWTSDARRVEGKGRAWPGDFGYASMAPQVANQRAEWRASEVQPRPRPKRRA